jgi:hypothetical protein
MSDLQSAFISPPRGVSPKKWARLEAFLGALPPASAARLFEALEADARAGSSLPAAEMLGVLRPRLVGAGARFPQRRPSAQRLFFTPFEDFLVASRRGRKRLARIARASAGPIFALVLKDPACADAARAAADLDAAIARGERDLGFLEARLFAAAGEGFRRLIAHADADAAFREDLAARLAGGEGAHAGAAALHDLAEIGRLIPFVDFLKEAQRAFPRPAPAPTEEDLYVARRLYARATAEHPDLGAYALLAIAARFDAPERALRLAHHMANAVDERLPLAREDAGAVLDATFEDFESLARGLERDADDDPDTDDAPARLRHFATFAQGMAQEAARARDAALSNRVEAARDVAAAALARFCEQSLAALRRAQPTRHAGGSSRLMALRPDVERALDRRTERGAREGALFLSRAEGFGEALGRPDAAGSLVATARAEARRYAGDLVLEIRAAEGAARDAARKRMDAVLKAVEPLLPADETAVLKERASAAAVSA